MTARQRLALVAAALVVIVVAFVVVRPGSDDGDGTATTPTTTEVVQRTVQTTDGRTQTVTRTVQETAKPAIPTVVVRGGEPVGGVQRLEFRKGDTIDFRVRAGAPGGEIHFHGYDVHRTVPASGGTVRFTLPAKFDGRFVVELEASGTQIAEVEVQP
jgi:hypothetical protein